MRTPVRVYLALGSNVGDREGNIAKAVELLKKHVANLRLSSLYDTAPEGYTDQPRFLNAVCAGETTLTPSKLLSYIKSVEKMLGRKAGGPPMGPRPLDIDIIYYGDLVIDSPPLTIPHPRMSTRAFVVVPLAEIAPQMKHPILKKTAKALAKAVEGRSDIRKMQSKKA